MEIPMLARGRLTKTKCERCGRVFAEGDKVVSSGHGVHGRKGRSLRKYYHKDCWEEMFFESSCSDEEIDKELRELGYA